MTTTDTGSGGRPVALNKFLAEPKNMPNLITNMPLKAVMKFLRELYNIPNGEMGFAVNKFYLIGPDSVTIVRGKLRELVGLRVSNLNPQFKTIIIANAGEMTRAVQNILWCLLEANLQYTRFILICEAHSYKLSPQIINRCCPLWVADSALAAQPAQIKIPTLPTNTATVLDTAEQMIQNADNIFSVWKNAATDFNLTHSKQIEKLAEISEMGGSDTIMMARTLDAICPR